MLTFFAIPNIFLLALFLVNNYILKFFNFYSPDNQFIMCLLQIVDTRVYYCLLLDNMEFRSMAERHMLFQLINKATFSVDTFFFIR